MIHKAGRKLGVVRPWDFGRAAGSAAGGGSGSAGCDVCMRRLESALAWERRIKYFSIGGLEMRLPWIALLATAVEQMLE